VERNRLHEYNILEEIARDETISQRDLAQRLNLSVGLVNAFVKRLIAKGYFKVTTIPRNRVRYLFTPKGIAEKSRLSLEYLHYSVSFYRHIKQSLTEVFGRITRAGGRRLVVWGGGEFSELACLYASQAGLEVVGVILPEKPRRRTFMSLPVHPPERLDQYEFDSILIASVEDAFEAVEHLTRLGVARERIFTLDGGRGR
jgi:DNA-binding MarR family transcriptional regulator